SFYHSIPNFGTRGGFKLNLPDFVKCGIFNFGNDKLKLINHFICSIAPLTVSFALFIGVVIASFNEFHTSLVLLLTESQPLDTEVFTELTESETLVLMLFQTSPIMPLMLFHIANASAFISFHLFKTSVFTSLILFDTTVLISFHLLEITVFTSFHLFVVFVFTSFHLFVKPSIIS